MPTVLMFSVTGIAQPQGSSKAFMPKGARFPVVTSDNPQLKGWRQLVAFAAGQAQAGGALLEGAIDLHATFYLPRPKRLDGVKHEHAPHLTKPDLDKLVRAVGDALTGVVWRDDSQVTSMTVAKAYAAVGGVSRVDVRITARAGGVPLYSAIPHSSPPLPFSPGDR